MNVTAVVLSKAPYVRQWPGLVVQNEVQTFTCSTDACRARFGAIPKVQTEFFFYLDDDDELPEDYLIVLEECMAQGQPLTYTDEAIVGRDGVHRVSKKQDYDPGTHYTNPLLVHHLALCRTADAKAAVLDLPTGPYWPEFLLYWKLAKAGVAYVPRVGYVWHACNGGLHTKPETTIAQMRSVLLVKDEHMR